jgi:hypothetical protein
MLQCVCPICQERVKADTELAGMWAPCPACERMIQFPLSTGGVTVAAQGTTDDTNRVALAGAMAVLSLALVTWVHHQFRHSAVVTLETIWATCGLSLVVCACSVRLLMTMVSPRRVGDHQEKSWPPARLALFYLLSIIPMIVMNTMLTYVRCSGRPLREEDGIWTAREAVSSEWLPKGVFRVDGMTDDDSQQCSKYWTNVALAEHASVATFAKLSMDLLAAGAPPELINRAHRAALDEVGHARLAFGLASAYAGYPIGPGATALPRSLRSSMAPNLTHLALECLVDGCLGEGLASAILLEAAKNTRNAVLSNVLHRMGVDEARHAELAWAIIEWCVEYSNEALVPALRAAGRMFPSRPSGDPILLEATTGMSEEQAAKTVRSLHLQVCASISRRLEEIEHSFPETARAGAQRIRG